MNLHRTTAHALLHTGSITKTRRDVEGLAFRLPLYRWFVSAEVPLEGRTRSWCRLGTGPLHDRIVCA
jgi:hypothetical protein